MDSPVYDALLVVSFGGPERREDVLPFLENVKRGKNVPHERLPEVAEHYYRFGGKSPINGQNRALIEALRRELDEKGPRLPIYWGNRNWHPLLADTVRQMRQDGVRRALAYVTAATSSYSSCRQYLEDIERARREAGPAAPRIDKLRLFYNHPGFIEAMASRVWDAYAKISASDRPRTKLVFTAHSIPLAMAQTSRYAEQLEESCRLVARQVEIPHWTLAYQSRSGPPEQPWLGPDIADYLKMVDRQGAALAFVIAPIGFVSDHMEVLYDLDTEVRELCERRNLRMVRAGTVGTHPKFIGMIRELILERTQGAAPRAMGRFGPAPDQCPPECCPQPMRAVAAPPRGEGPARCYG